jgi:hypothetical protein
MPRLKIRGDNVSPIRFCVVVCSEVEINVIFLFTFVSTFVTYVRYVHAIVDWHRIYPPNHFIAYLDVIPIPWRRRPHVLPKRQY